MAPTSANTPIKSSESRYNQKRSSAGITPIIKIVHVYAPTLVRTDVANFRALVQEMTGNVAHASRNIKDINTDCSPRASTTNHQTINKDKLEARTRRTRLCVSSKMRAHGAHREDGYSSSLQEGIKEKRENEKGRYAISKSSACNEEEEEEEAVCVESPKSWESSCDRSVNSFFAESEEACVEDHLYNMQQQSCSAYFATNWRQPLDIPGGFEPFDLI